MILALDISTSCTGIALLDQDNNSLLVSQAIKLKPALTFYEKVQAVKEHLESNIRYHFNITDIVIEAPLMAFAGQKSSAQILSTLQAFNGAVSYVCEDMFHIKPEYISATTARKLCGIKIPKGIKAKPVVLEHIKLTDDQFLIEYNKANKPTPSTFDRLDAYVLAKAYSSQLQSNK